ncbi:MAG: SMI1/KNR4 family protein [Chitinophagales bacterium]
MKRIHTIKKKLEELKNLDKRFSIFGSGRHKYQLNKTLSEKEISQIEKENQIVLSKEYKEILKNLGNGGAGCGYGLERMELKNINPPYIGTKKLLRNWKDPQKIDCDMVELDEISGYIKLFDYGCGMEYCLIVNGAEKEDLIFFDCDGRFEKMENKSLLDIYEKWLNNSLDTLKRIQQKMEKMPLQEVIDSEWEIKNFSIKEMILSIINAEPIKGSHSGNDMKIHLEKEYKKWKSKKQSSSKKWWRFLKKN